MIEQAEWQSIYAAIKRHEQPPEITEGTVTDRNVDEKWVRVREGGSEPLSVAGMEYEAAIYIDGQRQTLRVEPRVPEIGDRVVCLRPNGSWRNARVVAVAPIGNSWKQPEDVAVGENFFERTGVDSIETNNNVSVIGNVDVSGALAVTSNADVTGALREKGRRTSLRVFSRTAPADTPENTSENSLDFQTIPANLLGTGAVIKVYAVGSSAGSAGQRTVRLYIGNTLIIDLAVAAGVNTNFDYFLEAIITITGTASQVVGILAFINTDGSAGTPSLSRVNYLSASESVSSGLVVKLNATTANTADEITSQLFVVEVSPA